MMDIQGTIENIHAYLSGQLTVEQVEAFELWRNASELNARLVNDVQTAWESALLYEAPQFDSDLAIGNMPFGKAKASMHRIEPKSTRRRLSRWAAAAALILAVGAWSIYQLNEAPMRELDGRSASYINLEDGTEVFLDQDGVFSFPETFSGKERLVMLDGEAYFDVAKDAKRQFVIKTDFAKVVVLGTRFDVNEDDSAETVQVYVTEGKVRLQPSGSDVYIDIVSGESAMYEHKTGKLQLVKTANMNDIAWHTKRLQFAKTPMTKVIRDIEAAYDVSIDYQNSGISECTFSSLYDKVEVTRILEDMSVVFGFRTASPSEGHYVLNGGSCNPALGK